MPLFVFTILGGYEGNRQINHKKLGTLGAEGSGTFAPLLTECQILEVTRGRACCEVDGRLISSLDRCFQRLFPNLLSGMKGDIAQYWLVIPPKTPSIAAKQVVLLSEEVSKAEFCSIFTTSKQVVLLLE